MKIAIVSGSFPPIRCGVGDYVERFTRALAGQGATVHVITSRGAKQRLAGKGVTIWPDVKDWGVRGMVPIRDRLARLAPDVVHMQYPTVVYGKRLGINALPWLVKRRWPRLPLVTTLHEFAQYSRLGQWRLAPNIRLADAVVVTTREERDAVVARYPSARRRVSVNPIGSNIPVAGSSAAGHALLKKLGVEPGDRLLAYFGWVGPGKGVLPLIEATRRLWNAGWRVRLVGITAFRPRADAFHREVELRAKELEIQGRITWTGFLPERQVSDVLLACEACVLPFDDGLRLNRGSFLAALQHGVPLVTTHGPATKLLAPRAGRRLVTCDPDAAAIATATAGLLRRPVARDRHAGRRYPEFTWAGIAAAYGRVYRKPA
jgi:glycosyltransferase involved in cell wall biosynthesis